MDNRKESINLYVDDLRDCPPGFVIARSYEDAILYLKSRNINILSLDHDLGEDQSGNLNPSGYDLVKYICENGLRANKIYIHTDNSVGRDNMYQTLLGAQKRGFIESDIEIYYYPITENKYSGKTDYEYTLESKCEELTRESKKEIKKKWKAEYLEIEKMVNEWDPLNLVKHGAPQDEYDCLSTQLLSLLHKGAQINELNDFVNKELYEHFGLRIEDIKPDYRERYKNRIIEFCTKVYYWFKNSN
jgi:hypothetical protein